MCGITGFAGQGAEADLNNMLATIRHRGPDDSGVFFRGGIGLAHARLSIVDLSAAGHQPMFNADKSLAIVFNGEIYNYWTLRKRFFDSSAHSSEFACPPKVEDSIGERPISSKFAHKRLHYQFSSQTDTEVILAMYEKFGERCFEYLNGMFAIAIFDVKRNRLILARDRFGEKPLYYAIFDGTLVFGSEIKALVAHPLVKKELDLASLGEYLLRDYVPTPRSIFKNIFKLEAGSLLVWESGKVDIRTIIKSSRHCEEAWRRSNPDVIFKRLPRRHDQSIVAPRNDSVTLEDSINVLDKFLEKSVCDRLVADVPVGVFLSGGLDSSAVAYYAQKNRAEKIKTFTISFGEASFDESKYARQVADYLGTEHYEQKLTAGDALEAIMEITNIVDEPLADASIIPTYLLSKFARQKITVALGGDGGDELFAGYPTFQAEKVVGLYLSLPQKVRNFIENVIDKLPARNTNFSLEFKLKKFLDGVTGLRVQGTGLSERHQMWLGSFSEEMQKELLVPEVYPYVIARSPRRSDPGEISTGLLCRSPDADVGVAPRNDSNCAFNELLNFYTRTYLSDQVLVKTDRASMAHALEVRAPFLDYDLADFVLSLPYKYKLHGFMTKYILKKLMAGKLPRNIIYRQKKGFGIPVALWLRGPWKEWCLDTLSRENIEAGGLFNYGFIKNLLDDHMSGRRDNRKLLWNLLAFEMWRKRWG